MVTQHTTPQIGPFEDRGLRLRLTRFPSDPPENTNEVTKSSKRLPTLSLLVLRSAPKRARRPNRGVVRNHITARPLETPRRGADRWEIGGLGRVVSHQKLQLGHQRALARRVCRCLSN